MAGTKEAAYFYDSMIEKEKEITEIKDEVTKAIAAFASSNDVTSDGVLRAIKDRKAFLKDKAKFLITERDSSKVFELFDYDPNLNLFED